MAHPVVLCLYLRSVMCYVIICIKYLNIAKYGSKKYKSIYNIAIISGAKYLDQFFKRSDYPKKL